MAMTMTEPTQPPSREPGQADAELEADIAAFRTEMEHWNNPPRDAALTLRLLADRTQREECIRELKERLALRSITAHFLIKADDCDWHVCELEPCVSDRALLEVPDAE